MSYLVLKAQMDLLRRNLMEVKQAVDAAEQGRKQLQAIVDDPIARAQEAVDNMLDPLIDLRYELEGLDEEESEAARDAVNQLDRDREELKKALAASKRAFKQLQRRTPAALGGFKETLDTEVVNKHINSKIEKLRELDADIDRAIQLDRDGKPAEALAEARDVWTAYSTKVLPQTREVFEDYVDFLAGLALRYTGLDRGICVIADELMAGAGRLPNFPWRSVTVPVRSERVSMSHMIGLGFPEWTIWSLPLSAHALGAGWIRTELMTPWLAEQESEEDAREPIRVCVADAVATCVLGPAYPCALILLRLDPFHAFDDDHLAAKRAWVVLETLERLSNQDPNRYADEILEQLRLEWHEALRQAGHGPILDTPGTTGGLSQSETDRLTVWVNDVIGLIGDTPVFDGERWSSHVLDLSASLAAGNEIGDEVMDEDRADVLRDLLNAAWHCRLNHDSADLNRIDETAKAVWEELEPEVQDRKERRNERRRRTERRLRQASARKPDERDGAGARGVRVP